jgi:hypothetical protein
VQEVTALLAKGETGEQQAAELTDLSKTVVKMRHDFEARTKKQLEQDAKPKSTWCGLAHLSALHVVARSAWNAWACDRPWHPTLHFGRLCQKMPGTLSCNPRCRRVVPGESKQSCTISLPSEEEEAEDAFEKAKKAALEHAAEAVETSVQLGRKQAQQAKQATAKIDEDYTCGLTVLLSCTCQSQTQHGLASSDKELARSPKCDDVPCMHEAQNYQSSLAP